MYIKSAIKIATITCLVAILASCASFQPVEEKLPPLRVEYTYWWGDFTILVAQELGLFEKYNVQVEPVYFDVFSEALPALATGAVDGGLFALGDTLNTNDNSPIKIVAVYDDGGTNYVVGSPEILTPADLKGKKIGVTLGTIYELFVMETLKQGGLTTRDVTLINTEVEDVPENLGTTIDAGYAWDPFASDALAAGGTLLFKSSEINTINPDVIVFSADVVQQRPEDIRAFLKAWFEAVEYRKSNPDEANQIIAKALEVSIDEISEDSYIYTAQDNKSAITDQASSGSTKLDEAINANAEFLIRIGALSKIPAFDQLIDPSYIP